MIIQKREKQYEIRSYDGDMFGNIRLTALSHFLQDMADIHAAEYNIGFDYCHANNIAWILSNYHIKIHKMPKWGEDINISTWPSTIRKIASTRDFSVKNLNGELLVEASSQWVTIDLENRKPVSILTHIPHFTCIDERALDSTFPKIPEPDSNIEPLIRHFDVYYNDIDTNGHVNNCVYFFWLTESFSHEWLKSHSIKEIQIAYKSETYINDKIKTSTYINGKNAIQIITAQDGRELARMRTEWE